MAVSARWGALALLGLIALFWTHQIALGGGDGVGYGDIRLYYYPLYEAAYGSRFGSPLTLWNPYELCGVPWLATLQGGLLYPPHLLYLVLPTSYGLAASSLLHLCLIAVSTAALARRVGLSDSALVVAVALATLSSRYASMLLTPNTLEAASWLPLGAFAVVGLARGSVSRSSALLAGCLAASILAGYPQASVYCVYAWGALFLMLLVGERPAARDGALRFGGFVGAMAMGALLAGVQLGPTFELASEGTRSLTSLAPGRFVAYLAPRAFVRPGWGLAAVALFPVALLARRQRTLAVAAIVLCVSTLLFSWGPSSPAYRLYRALPLLDAFRFPHRIVFVTDFFFALTAAIGLDALLDSFTRRASERRGVSKRFASLLVLVGAIVALRSRGAEPASLTALGAVCVCVAAALWGFRTSGTAPRAAAAAIAAVLAATVLVESYAAPRKSWDLPYAADRYPAGRMQPPAWREAIEDGERALLLGAGPTPSVFPKLASVHRIRAANGYEPMNLRRQAEYFSYLTRGTADAASSVRPFSGRLFERQMDLEGVARRRRLLDLASVRHVVVSNREDNRALRRFVSKLGVELVGRIGSDTERFENERALPRAFVTYRVKPAPATAELLERLSRAGFDPLVSSYVEADDAGLGADDEAPRRGHPARIVVDSPQLVEMEADLDTAGLLVLADSYDSGWRATVDGEPAEILPTNHLFRGVRVPAGTHRVRFEYRPWSIWAGVASTLVGVACVIGVWRRGAGGRGEHRDSSPRQHG